MEISVEAQRTNICFRCVLSSLASHSSLSWRERSVLCFQEINLLSRWLMREWKSLIYGCWGLKIATAKRRFQINFTIRLKNSFKMLSFMISTSLSKNSTSIKNYQPRFKTKSQSLFSKHSNLTSATFSWTQTQVSSINWLWVCIAESTSQEKL